MDKGLEYDIKQASNSQLTPSAQKNYAENAQADVKSDINMMGQATMGDRVSPLDYSGNNIKLKAPTMMDADLADMPVENIAGQGTNPTRMKKNMSPKDY